MNTYEVLFLFDPTFGASWEAVETELNRLMSRAKAEVLLTKRLEDRRLTFEIKGRKRGLYVLTYFKSEGDRISGLERDIRISESILRALILRADELTEEQMRNATLGAAYETRPSRDEPYGRDYAGRGGREDEYRADRAVEHAVSDRQLIPTGADEIRDPET